MSLTILDHALGSHLLSILRDKDTSYTQFQQATKRISYLLMCEATRDLKTEPCKVTTPLEVANGETIAQNIVLVPILRAGLALLNAAQELLPDANVGFIGLQRDEKTAWPSEYYCKLPTTILPNTTAFLLDPMLATGGSAAKAIDRLVQKEVAHVILVCVVAAPEGVEYLQKKHPTTSIYTAVLDRGLNAANFIVPGLGDYGDRHFDS